MNKVCSRVSTESEGKAWAKAPLPYLSRGLAVGGMVHALAVDQDNGMVDSEPDIVPMEIHEGILDIPSHRDDHPEKRDHDIRKKTNRPVVGWRRQQSGAPAAQSVRDALRNQH